MIKKKTLLLIPALLVLMLVWAAPAHSTNPTGEWHTWEVQGDYGPEWDNNYDEAFAQPQKYVGEGKSAPQCGTWYQQDYYPYAAQEHGKSIAEVIEDGLLHDGEDHHLTGHEDGKWRFVYSGLCPDPEPTPSVTPTPEPEGEIYRYYGASSCVPGVEGLAVQSFGADTYVDGELVESKSWTEHVSDPGCTLPASDPQEDVAPPATPVEAEATFTG